jgi:hypothetical protein
MGVRKLEDNLDELYDEPPRRGIVKNILRRVVTHIPLVGRFYNNTTTYKPKESDNDYSHGEDDKYGDSGVC